MQRIKCKVCKLEEYSRPADNGRTKSIKAFFSKAATQVTEAIAKATSLKTIHPCNEEHRLIAIGIRRMSRRHKAESVRDKELALERAEELLMQYEDVLKVCELNSIEWKRANALRESTKFVIAQRKRRLNELRAKPF